MNTAATLEHVQRTPPPPHPGLTVDLRGYSYDDRRVILPALLQALSSCGGWMLDRQALPSGRMEFWFEVQLEAALDLYSSLISAGLELIRGSHIDLTALCTLSRHHGKLRTHDRVVSVRLEISFLDEADDSLPTQAAKAAAA
ncbi:MAG: hypothetical protein V4555_00205 [Acidobacteriota bacterium]